MRCAYAACLQEQRHRGSLIKWPPTTWLAGRGARERLLASGTQASAGTFGSALRWPRLQMLGPGDWPGAAFSLEPPALPAARCAGTACPQPNLACDIVPGFDPRRFSVVRHPGEHTAALSAPSGNMQQCRGARLIESQTKSI